VSIVGLSVSFCIADIARGLVKEQDVSRIIGATKCESQEDWDYVIESYKKSYWRDLPEAEAICRRFIEAGKIQQPRLVGAEIHNIAGGHWIVNGKQTRNGG